MPVDTEISQDAKSVSLPVAFGILSAVMVGIAGYITLATMLGLSVYYGAFVFLWYWAICKSFSFKDVGPILVGALFGLVVAYVMQLGAMDDNGYLTIFGLLVIIVSIFLSIIKRMEIVVNPAFFLFLTVMTIPLIQEKEDLMQVAGSLLLGAVYFGLIVWVAGRVFAAKGAKSNAPS